jgi:ribosomal protein S18 acetylase RimI-like enzyme
LRDEESRTGTFAPTVVTMRFLVGRALLGVTGVLLGDAARKKSARPAKTLAASSSELASLQILSRISGVAKQPLRGKRGDHDQRRTDVRGESQTLRIRLMADADVEAVVRVWHASGLAAYPFIERWQRFTLELARSVFRGEIASTCEIWVAEAADEIVGYLALRGSYVDRLYVSPQQQRRGIGTALLQFAMQRSPAGLELHTHQKNTPARIFYERHGFVPVKYGFSPPPENEPDVEYHWRPRGTAPAQELPCS